MLSWILENYDLTAEEFNVVAAVIMAEALGNSYEDAFNVATLVRNRRNSIRYNTCPTITANFQALGVEFNGQSLYHIVRAPLQFEVIPNGRYLEFLGVTEGPKYQAVIDLFFNVEIDGPVHNFLQFRSSCSAPGGRTQFTPGGNRFFDVLTQSDRMDIEENIQRRVP